MLTFAQAFAMMIAFAEVSSLWPPAVGSAELYATMRFPPALPRKESLCGENTQRSSRVGAVAGFRFRRAYSALV